MRLKLAQVFHPNIAEPQSLAGSDIQRNFDSLYVADFESDSDKMSLDIQLIYDQLLKSQYKVD